MNLIISENFRALFYAPFYLAHATGAYAAEGVSVTLQTSPSPAESARMLQAGTVDLMWGGPLRVLMERETDPACTMRCFQAVVCRDPFLIIGRTPAPAFAMASLASVRLATVAEVPTPWLCLQDDLRRAGIDPASLNRRADLPMAASADALRRGEIDAVQVFQPHAEALLQDGTGHLWYAGAARGPTAYTNFVALERTLQQHHGALGAITRGMRATLQWMAITPGADIAPLLAAYFPDLPEALIAACIDRYRALGLWNDDPMILREGFARLRGAMLSGGAIQRGASFEECFDVRLI
jgi:NitT/TauT family transport system substrate-binding protein